MRLMLYDEWKRSIHQEDGIPKERETQLRIEAVSFMTAYGTLLDLAQITIAKGVYLFHIISQQMSFKKFDRLIYGCVCIFLSSKLDDKFRAHILKESVKAFAYLQNEYKKQAKTMMKSTNTVPSFQYIYDDISKEKIKLFSLDKKFADDIEEKFVNFESDILQMIGFDVRIDLPYQFVERHRERLPAFYKNNPELYINSRTWINDSLKTIVGLYYEPKLIATAAINNAAEMLNLTLPDCGDMPWFTFFGGDVTMDVITEISIYIMETLNKSTKLITTME